MQVVKLFENVKQRSLKEMPDTYLIKKLLKETEGNMIICQDLLNNSNDEQEKKRLTEAIERDEKTVARLTEKLEKLKKGD